MVKKNWAAKLEGGCENSQPANIRRWIAKFRNCANYIYIYIYINMNSSQFDGRQNKTKKKIANRAGCEILQPAKFSG